MSAFYNRISQTVIRLIKKYGKPTTFRAFVTVANPNPSKPPIKTAVDNTYSSVFTQYKTEEIDDTRVLKGDMKVLVQGSIDPAIKIDGQVIDPADNAVWKIINMDPVIPGPTNVLWKIQVRK